MDTDTVNRKLVDSLSEIIDEIRLQKNDLNSGFAQLQQLIDDEKQSNEFLDEPFLIMLMFNTYLIDEITGNFIDTNFDDLIIDKISTVLDLSLLFDSNYSIQILINLLVNLTPLKSFDIILNIIFEKNSERIMQLTKNNQLQGKIKPGSKILILFNSLKYRSNNFNFEIKNFLKFLKFLIFDCFEINDKLSQSLNWQIYKNSNFLSYSKTNKFNKITKNGNIKFFDLFTTIKNLISISELNLIQISNKSDFELTYFDLINKKMPKINSCYYMPLKNYDFNNINYILDANIFDKQLQNKSIFMSLKLENLIILNFLKSMIYENFQETIKTVSLNNNLFKRPLNLSSSITNNDAKKKINNYINYQLNWLKTQKFHHSLIIRLLSQNENTFTIMKLKNFSYPKISSLSGITENSVPLKRKMQELSENQSLKKRKYFHKMGVPKLSKLYTIDHTSVPVVPKQAESSLDNGDTWHTRRRARDRGVWGCT